MEDTKVVNMMVDGKERPIKFNMPVLKDRQEAKKIYNRTFSTCLNNGAILRDRLEDVMKEQNLWNDQKTQKYKTLLGEITQAEFTLMTGLDYVSKKKVPLKHARKLAIQLRDELRPQITELLQDRNRLDSKTADGQADQEEFNYYISSCMVYNELDVVRLAHAYADFYYGIDSLNLGENLTEEKFLKDWKFVNASGDLVDKDGNLVDRDGNILEGAAEAQIELPEVAVFLDDEGVEISLADNTPDTKTEAEEESKEKVEETEVEKVVTE